MNIFSIISEGVTDQVVLVNILAGYFNDVAFANTRFVYSQPLIDKTVESKTESFGGWYNVFQYCRSENFITAFELNEMISDDNHYYIIQIDTDVSHEIGYDVPKLEDVDQYINAVKQKLIDTISQPVYEQYQSKIFFAICVNQLECWLLPILYERKDKKKMAATDNCFTKVEQAIKAALKKDNLNQYISLSKDYSKQKNLKRLYPTNSSLKIFIDSIENHFHQLTPP